MKTPPFLTLALLLPLGCKPHPNDAISTTSHKPFTYVSHHGGVSLYAVKNDLEISWPLIRTPTGVTAIGTEVNVPECLTWGIIVMAFSEDASDDFVKELTENKVPEILIMQSDASTVLLETLTQAEYLVRLDMSISSSLSDDQLLRLTNAHGLRELIVSPQASISENKVSEFQKLRPDVRLFRGHSDDGAEANDFRELFESFVKDYRDDETVILSPRPEE